jgi:hypothetical protein
MKLLSKLTTAIFAAIVVAGSIPTTARALYNLNSAPQYNKEFTLIDLRDATAGPGQGFWVLNKGAPKYNLLYGGLGTWTVSPLLFNDGSLALEWFRGFAQLEVGFHRIDSNGKLVAVGIHGIFAPLAPPAGPVGKSSLHQSLRNDTGRFILVVGPDAKVVKSISIDPFAGTTTVSTDEYSKSFSVSFLANPVVGRAGQATIWEFNELGEPTAARTYAY